jgi:hypothetical protein
VGAGPRQASRGAHIDEGAWPVGTVNGHHGPLVVRVVVQLYAGRVYTKLQRKIVEQGAVLIALQGLVCGRVRSGGGCRPKHGM